MLLIVLLLAILLVVVVSLFYLLNQKAPAKTMPEAQVEQQAAPEQELTLEENELNQLQLEDFEADFQDLNQEVNQL